jgi:hypothetical protein
MSVATRETILRLLELTPSQLDGLNNLAGVELTALDGITAGTVTASKAVVVDASKNASSFGNIGTATLAATGAVTSASAAVTGLTTTGTLLYKPVTEVVNATNVITAAESGSVFFLNSATEFVSTLPAAAAGLKFTFIVTAAPSGASYTIVTDSSANIIKGQIYTLDVNSTTDADFETSGGDTISFVDAKSVAGDTVELICDGTNWFARGFCSVFDAITITTAS